MLFNNEKETTEMQTKKNKKITLLVLADLHRSLSETEKKIIEKYRPSVDVTLTLGDIPKTTLKSINPDFGVLGNHDILGMLGDKDIHGVKVSSNSVTITGLQGSHRYKNGPFIMYTQEESLQLDIPKADILVSHDSLFRNILDDVHCGLKGITKYIEKYNPVLLIHGHNHKNTIMNYGDTTVVGVYKCSLVKIINDKIIVINIF